MAGEHLKKITAKAKQIRKAHPKMKWTDAVKAASKTISGVPTKRVRKGAVKIASSKPAAKVTVRVGSIGAVCVMAGKIVGSIDKMEKRYKSEKNRDMREFLKHAINAEHDKLDLLKKTLNKTK